MAINLNRVLLAGNLTRDPELKTINSGSGTCVGNFSIAINRRWKGQDGDMREETCFIDCECWGRQAEVIAQYFTKGSPIYIEGRLKLDQWDDQQGNKRSRVRVHVEQFQFVSGRESGADASNRSDSRSDRAGYGDTAQAHPAQQNGGARKGAARESSHSFSPSIEDEPPF